MCVLCQMKEWDSSNVIMTGNSDGVVRVRPAFALFTNHFPFAVDNLTCSKSASVMCAAYNRHLGVLFTASFYACIT